VQPERLARIEARRLGLHADHEHVTRSLRERGDREQHGSEHGGGEGS
jgi:hypothetical protein